MKKKIVFVLMGIILGKGIEAGVYTKAGICGVQFLKIGVGAKGMGMGDAFIGASDDVSSIYWNPAGLIRTQDREFILTHNEWLEDTNYEFIGYSQALKNGKLGVGLTYFGYGNLIGRDEDDRLTGNFTAYDMTLFITYAKELKNLLIGETLKVIHQKNESKEANGVAMDLGFQYNLPQTGNIILSGVIANIGPDMKFISQNYKLPLTFKTGLCWNFLPLLFSNNLRITADLIKSIDDNIQFNIGGEYKLENIFLRVGYNGLKKEMTSGLGFILNSYQIDYAYIPFENLGNFHVFSFMRKF